MEYEVFVEEDSRQINRKEFKKAVSLCAGAMLFYQILSFIINLALSFLLVRYENRKYYDLIDVSLLVATSVVSFVLSFCLLFGKRFFGVMKGYKALKKNDLRAAVFGFPATYTVMIGASILFNLLFDFLGSYGIGYDAEEVLNPSYTGLTFVIYTLHACIVAPVVEELVFRGFVLGNLKKYGGTCAVVSSAFIFGIVHGIYVQIPQAFCAGIVLGIIAYISNSIVPSILVHMAINTLVTIIGETQWDGIVLVLLALIIAGVAVIHKFAKWYNSQERDSKKKGYILPFFTSIPMLIFIALHLLLGALYIV